MSADGLLVDCWRDAVKSLKTRIWASMWAVAYYEDRELIIEQKLNGGY